VNANHAAYKDGRSGHPRYEHWNSQRTNGELCAEWLDWSTFRNWVDVNTPADHCMVRRDASQLWGPENTTSHPTLTLSGILKSDQSNNTSGRRGVNWNKREERWVARIMVERRSIFLGYFDSFECAVAAREAAERKYFQPIIESAA
jgi:hypothetical protein